jgi:hypothetical protein
MITTDRSTVLHEAPIIYGLRISPNEEKVIQGSKIVSRNGKLKNRYNTATTLGFHICPIQSLVKSGGRVESSPEVF